METKTWNISANKIPEEIEVRSHFGWEKVSCTANTLTMKREKTVNTKRLIGLEKQYNYLKKPFPVSGVVYLAVGLVLLIPGILLIKTFILGFLVLLASLICLVLGIAFIVTFIAIAPKRKILIKQLLDDADELTGKKITTPLPHNIKKPDTNSFQIKKAVYNGELKI